MDLLEDANLYYFVVVIRLSLAMTRHGLIRIFFVSQRVVPKKPFGTHPNSIVVGDKNPTKKSDDLPIVSPSNIPPYLPIDFHHLCHGQQLDSTFTPGKIGDAHLTMFKGIYFIYIYSTCTYTYTYTYIYTYIYIYIS